MALINKPKKSKYQVGDTVFFLSNGKGTSAQIVKVSSSVSNPDNDENGIQENIYYLEGFVKGFAERELFHSMNALMFDVKGDYLHKWGNSEQILFNSEDVISYSDFSYCLLSEENLPTSFQDIDFSCCIFEGAYLRGAIFNNSTLTECSFRDADLTGASLFDANISNSNFIGTDLTDVIFNMFLMSKSSFKSTVGAGNWDPETTIWVDGNPIG